MGPAHIDRHKFFIARAGYGSIAPKRGAIVHGVLWRVSAHDRAALDRYEEVESGLYRPETVPVHWKGKLLPALVYVANDGRPGRPSASYRDMVLNAAYAWALPDHYIRSTASEMQLP